MSEHPTNQTDHDHFDRPGIADGDSTATRFNLSRRDCLRLGAATALSFGAVSSGAVDSLFDGASQTHAADTPGREITPQSVAAVVTVYYRNSHADVILGKIMDGWEQDGGPGPALKLAAVYIDQFPDSDVGRDTCNKHGVPIFDSIEKAITVGGDRIPVDGVLCIGEHGNYPLNDIGQQLYPRRKFFEQITDTFRKYDRVVPVFNDKHLGPVWSDAKWTYDRAREMKVPFMAGSSLPVGYRTNDIDLPMDSDIEAAVGIGYSGLEIYGIHALEFYQYHIERRRGGERGVKSVQYLQGAEMWSAVDSGLISAAAFDAALAVVPKSVKPNVGQDDVRKDQGAALFLFEYVDGFVGAVFMLSCIGGTAIGIKMKGRSQTIATAFDERTTPRFPHFAYLLKAIDKMIHSGRPTYPVERTLLTSGILDRVMNSRAQSGKRLITPELKIAYQPVDYPHAPHVDLLKPPT
jgi:hypothetical protein